MRGQRSKYNCHLWRPIEESKVCEARYFRSILKEGQQIISRAHKLLLDPVIQDETTNKEGSTDTFEEKFFNRE